VVYVGGNNNIFTIMMYHGGFFVGMRRTEVIWMEKQHGLTTVMSILSKLPRFMILLSNWDMTLLLG
jgi:hypothetical protein